ncbi:hypothetical protein [Flaviflexus equikiangi]|uniref:hypothetical protein n=1 Tax=Flaviflexus equikiangi TaxID=2758573 RepID=UPI0015F7378B|nr:hypothetical protein [Flaviflexus equikiangi]
MKEYLNENTLFNTVAMFLDESEDLLLVLEGPDDHLLLREFCTPQLNLMTATGGRSQVLSTAKLASDRGLFRARFLVDQDYDRFSGSTLTNLKNVFISDHHDCFLDLIHTDSSLLRRVIDVHCDSTRRRDDLAVTIPEPEIIEQEAFGLASMLAASRIVDARRELCLDFKRFRFGSLLVDEFDVGKIAEIVLTRSQYENDDRAEFVTDAISTHSEVVQMQHSPVGDHDLFSALARVMKQYNVHVSDDILQRSYILKVTCLALSKTGWYQRIQQWCESHGRTGFTCEPQSFAA